MTLLFRYGSIRMGSLIRMGSRIRGSGACLVIPPSMLVVGISQLLPTQSDLLHIPGALGSLRLLKGRFELYCPYFTCIEEVCELFYNNTR
jgi:hypothetical protein